MTKDEKGNLFSLQYAIASLFDVKVSITTPLRQSLRGLQALLFPFDAIAFNFLDSTV